MRQRVTMVAIKTRLEGAVMADKPLPPKPEPPEKPLPQDCCESGCDPCIFDQYIEALDDYKRRLAEWQARVEQQ